MTNCSVCGRVLTSPRSIKKGIGQICDRLDRGLPARKPRETAVEGVEFTTTGKKDYVQVKLVEEWRG